MSQIKKMVRWVRDGIMRWRKQVEDMQYHDGVEWVYTAYYDGGWTLEEIRMQTTPFGNEPWRPFDRGAQQAVMQIEAEQLRKQVQTNQKGEPVDVPFFIHPSNMMGETGLN